MHKSAFNRDEHMTQADTHLVFNQPTALENFNTYLSDAPLQYWVAAYGGDWANDACTGQAQVDTSNGDMTPVEYENYQLNVSTWV